MLIAGTPLWEMIMKLKQNLIKNKMGKIAIRKKRLFGCPVLHKGVNRRHVVACPIIILNSSHVNIFANLLAEEINYDGLMVSTFQKYFRYLHAHFL